MSDLDFRPASKPQISWQYSTHCQPTQPWYLCLFPKVLSSFRQSQWHRLHDSPAKHTIVSFVLIQPLYYSCGVIYSVSVAYFLPGSCQYWFYCAKVVWPPFLRKYRRSYFQGILDRPSTISIKIGYPSKIPLKFLAHPLRPHCYHAHKNSIPASYHWQAVGN